MLKYRWPWITTLLTVATIASPFGVNVLYLAFFSGDKLSNGIARPLVAMAAATVLALGLLEWIVKHRLRERRARNPKR